MSNKKRIGKYVILLNNKLGQGAFSQVYIGFIEQTLEEVAIKVVPKHKIEEDQYTKNAFYSEIQIMKKLKSPNIIRFMDVHQTKNNFYIILEKAQVTLRHTLKNAGYFDQKNTMKCLIQILNGFGELVKNGVIHRDLKPENILIKGDVLKIADFGFAKHTENNSFLKTIVGTPAYMAPQILCQQRYTYKCDIWSLGVIAYELLFGNLPWTFTEKNIQAIKKQILSKSIIFPQNILVSDQMKDFILGCICLDENKRYDWQQIFTHPIFGKRFAQNFKRQGSTKITFIMANFRMNLHCKNINLDKIIAKLGNKLNKHDFFSLIKFLYKEMNETDLLVLYSYIAKEDGFIYIEDFITLLKKFQCRMTGIDLSKIQMESEEGSEIFEKEVFKLMARLRNSIEKNNIDIFSIFQKSGLLKEKEMNLIAWQNLINQIDPSLGEKDVECLFKQFSLNNANQTVQVSYVYNMLCKIAQVVPIEEQ